MQQSPYAYILEIEGQGPAVFSWPNVVKKYIRDMYTDMEGELRLPPPGRLKLTQHKLNPRAGHTVFSTVVTDIARFVG